MFLLLEKEGYPLTLSGKEHVGPDGHPAEWMCGSVMDFTLVLYSTPHGVTGTFLIADARASDVLIVFAMCVWAATT